MMEPLGMLARIKGTFTERIVFMTPLTQENLDLKFEENIAYMTLTGSVVQEAMDQGLHWFDELCEMQDEFNICVEMAKNDFEDLSEVSTEFRRVARTLRRAVNAKKCAVLTDSMFLMNSAKVEGAVIPGLELMTFKIKSKEAAVKWLKGEPLVTQVPETELTSETPPAAKVSSPPNPAQNSASNDSGVSSSAAASTNPWDNLDLKKVDL